VKKFSAAVNIHHPYEPIHQSVHAAVVCFFSAIGILPVFLGFK
jgi:hypothetical protein